MYVGTGVQINLRLLFNSLCICWDGQLSVGGRMRSGTDRSLVMAKISQLLLNKVHQRANEGG